MDESTDILRRALARQLEARPMSQRELARRAGTSAATVCRYLRGEAEITTRTYERLAIVLGARRARLSR